MTADPWAAARRWLATQDVRNWAGRAAYNPVDPAMLDPILEDVFARRNRGRVPEDPAELDRLMRRLSGPVIGAVLATEHGRAAVEQRIQAYWDEPDLTVQDGCATADLGLTPGALERTTRAGWGVARSAFSVRGELRSDEVGRRLRDLRLRHPEQRCWELRVQVADYSHARRLRYRYDSARDRLFVVREDAAGKVFVSPRLGGDLDRVASGGVPTHTTELEAQGPGGEGWWP